MFSEKFRRTMKTHSEQGLAPTTGHSHSWVKRRKWVEWQHSLLAAFWLQIQWDPLSHVPATVTSQACWAVPTVCKPQYIIYSWNRFLSGIFSQWWKNISETMSTLNSIILRKLISINKGFRSVPNMKNLSRSHIMTRIWLAQREWQKDMLECIPQRFVC